MSEDIRRDQPDPVQQCSPRTFLREVVDSRDVIDKRDGPDHHRAHDQENEDEQDERGASDDPIHPRTAGEEPP